MGISSSLYIAMSGMSLSQAAMEVASHNIANVNTVGYSRQRINLETTPTWKSGGWGQMGTGVTAQNIARYHDEFLTRSIINKSAEYAREAARKSAIDSLEAFFNESDGNGINAAMNDFFALWDSVADAAEIDPTREELVSVAQTLAAQIAARRQDMDAIRQDLNSRVEAALQDVNLITEEIAALNQQIMAAEDPSRNQQANDLRDVRDALMTQLSELMSIEWWEDPTSGAVNITVPGGPPLVMNTGSYPLSGRVDSSGDIRVIANNRPGEPKWEEDVTERISGGAIGGWVDFRDQTMREFYLEYETFADQLIFQINNQHAQGVGQDLYAQSNSSSLISNLPSQLFSFTGLNNDLRLTALTPHLDSREPYSAKSDPENIAVRFVKSEKVANEVTSTVVWNDKDPGGGKWEITVVLPTDSNGNITATAEDVIRHINSERSPSPASGAPVLPPASVSGTYKIGDFISAESGFGENWGGLITFPGPSYPSGSNTYTSLDRSLANTAQQGHHLSYGSEYAEMTTSLKHTNNDVTFIAKDKGAAGEKIAVEYTAPAGANQPLSVTVLNRIDGSRIISVSLATDAS
ncbi:MAG: flagellar hook-associated protein FlgK, partial [Candidatus Adiutrix sp.]|nr:flagellar hook-associated protein FlgK [Candidatus Adiutrix sp.]